MRLTLYLNLMTRWHLLKGNSLKWNSFFSNNGASLLWPDIESVIFRKRQFDGENLIKVFFPSIIEAGKVSRSFNYQLQLAKFEINWIQCCFVITWWLQDRRGDRKSSRCYKFIFLKMSVMEACQIQRKFAINVSLI